ILGLQEAGLGDAVFDQLPEDVRKNLEKVSLDLENRHTRAAHLYSLSSPLRMAIPKRLLLNSPRQISPPQIRTARAFACRISSAKCLRKSNIPMSKLVQLKSWRPPRRLTFGFR